MASGKFCPQDENMLYFEERDGDLLEKCHTCDYEEISTESIVSTNVYNTQSFEDNNSYRYFRYAPFLSRTIHVPCPNAECPSAKDKNIQESVFFTKSCSMELVHICVVCNAMWNYVGESSSSS